MFLSLLMIILLPLRSDLVCEIALNAVETVAVEKGDGRKEIDIKRYARVEMVPGGTIEDSEVLRGVMLNKDVTHAKMRRYISVHIIAMYDGNISHINQLLWLP